MKVNKRTWFRKRFSNIHAIKNVRISRFMRKIRTFGGVRGIWTLAPLLTAYSLSRGAPSASWVSLRIKSNNIHLPKYSSTGDTFCQGLNHNLLFLPKMNIYVWATTHDFQGTTEKTWRTIPEKPANRANSKKFLIYHF